MIYVVGSGPSGIACARALLARGADVTMLDVGLDLEPERRALVDKFRSPKPSEWSQESLACYKAGMSASFGGVKYKTAYGSLYPYRDISSYKSSFRNFEAGPSFAKGGFSTVWGASLRTYRPLDLQGWPITSDELAPYYNEISSFMPVSGSAEAAKILRYERGDFVEPDLKVSRQIGALLQKAHRCSKELQKQGWHFDYSKLAISVPENGSDGCVYCALCMYGCPYGHIFNSAALLSEMQKNKRFQYHSGVFVESLKENEGEVRIVAREISGERRTVYSGEKVFLATGVFSTARILLQSYEMYDTPLRCLDSQYFLLPLISLERSTGISHEEMYTLNQLCVSRNDLMGRTKSLLQIYGYNDLYEGVFRKMLGPIFPAFRGLFVPFLERMLAVQGYLHSDDSAEIYISLKRSSAGQMEMRIEGERKKRTHLAMGDLLRQISKMSQYLRVFPVTPALSVGQPGRGYHSGGTFPMRVAPKMWESDPLGRPYSLKRTHVVDASVFPTIPAGPITVNVMANAIRIADKSMSHEACL